MKRIPRIKFPQRHPKPSDAASQNQAKPVGGSVSQTFFSGANKPANSGGGMASLQPKRTPLSQDEIESILVLKKESVRIARVLQIILKLVISLIQIKSVKKWTDEELRVLIDSCYKYLQGDPHASREPCLTHLERIFNGHFNFRQIEGKLSELSALHQHREEEEFYKVQYDKLKHKLGKYICCWLNIKILGYASSRQCQIEVHIQFKMRLRFWTKWMWTKFSDEQVRKAFVLCDFFTDDEHRESLQK